MKKQEKEAAVEVAKRSDIYRDEKGVRKQEYRRYKKNEDYEEVEAQDMTAMTGMVLKGIKEMRKERKYGRPRKYETLDEFLDKVEEYFRYIEQANQNHVCLIPDIEGLCAFLNISRETLNTWSKTRDASYSDAIKSVKNSIAFCKKQLALKGKIPPLVFATDFNNNHGYTQKQEVMVSANPNPLGDEQDPQLLAEKYKDNLPDVVVEEDD